MASDRPNAANVIASGWDAATVAEFAMDPQRDAAASLAALREAVNAGPDDAVTIEPDGTLTLSTLAGTYRGVPIYSTHPGAKP